MPPTATFKRKKPKKPKPERLTAGGMGSSPSVGPIGPATVPQTFGAQAPPFDAAYSSGVAGANTQYDNDIARITYEEGQFKQEYGFEDVSNPYNRASMLQRAYEKGQTANMLGHAAQGNLYSSALQGDQNEGTFQYNRSYDALSRDYAAGLQGFTFDRAQAGTNRDLAVAGHEGDRAANWSGYTPPDPGPGQGGHNPTGTGHLQAGSPAWAQNQAQWLKSSGGAMKGPHWAAIINALGYDPRTGGGGLKFRN